MGGHGRGRDDVVGLDSIVMNPKVWEASGHVDGFTDPMVDCKNPRCVPGGPTLCLQVKIEGESIGWISLLESESMHEDATRMAENLKEKLPSKESLRQFISSLMTNFRIPNRYWSLRLRQEKWVLSLLLASST